MKMTMTQKILAAHAGLSEVTAGQLINAKLDIVLGNDITTPVAIHEFKKAGFTDVFDKDRVTIVLDHFVPNKDIKAAEQSKTCREFACSHCVSHFYDVGKMGSEHALLPEQGIVTAGDGIIGADSHTCTYGALGAFSTGVGSTDMAAGMATGMAWFKVPSAIKFNLTGKLPENCSGKDVILTIIGMIGVDGALYKSMEFTGEGVKNLSMDDRLCICNMAIEAGAKNGIFPVDDITLAYLQDRSEREPVVYEADPDAEYEKVIDIDLAKIVPTVACPHLPENTHPASELHDIKVDQVVIGSCTNGRHGSGVQHFERQEDCGRHPLHHHSGHDADLPRMRGARLRDGIYRRGRCCFHPDIRSVPRRLYGHSGGGRTLHCHNEPQLRRPHGSCGQRSVPGFSAHGGSQRADRLHHRI